MYLAQLTNGMEEGENQNTPPRHVERTGWLDNSHIVYLISKQHCLTVHSLPRARGYIDSLVVLSPAHKVCKIAGS